MRAFLSTALCASWMWAKPQQPVTAANPAAPEAQQDDTSKQSQSPSPQSTPAQLAPNQAALTEPAQVTSRLRKVYDSAYRFSDLLTILQPERWKMEDTARKSFDETLQAARVQLKNLEEWRTQFSSHPDNADLGDKVVTAISDLLPSIEAVMAAVTQYESAPAAAQFRQPGDQLADLQKSLKSYLADLRARAERAINTPGLQVEQVSAPAAAAAPLTAVVAEPPPLSPDQVKALLYKIYVPSYRLQDLLSQEHPERWQASEAERAEFGQARQTLEANLKELEQLRAQFSGRPTSADLAFQTYVGLDDILPPLEAISRSVAKYEDTKLAAEYTDRGSQLAALRRQLTPYISFFLRNQDRTNQTLESNLSACQNQLGYAMHAKVQPAIPLVNVNPEFKGHGRVHHAATAVAKAETHKSATTRSKVKGKGQKAKSKETGATADEPR